MRRGPSRGLLRDCTTSPINRFAALIRTQHSTVEVEIRDPEPRAEYFTGITVDCGWKSCYLIHVGRPSLHRIVTSVHIVSTQ